MRPACGRHSLADERLFVEALHHHHVGYQLHVVRNAKDVLQVAQTAGNPGQLACPNIFILDLVS